MGFIPHAGLEPGPDPDLELEWVCHGSGVRQPSGHLIRPVFGFTPPSCISYANVNNYYGPCTYCSLDKGVACAQNNQLPKHMCAGHMC